MYTKNISLKAKHKFIWPPSCYFTFYENITLTKISYFSSMYYNILFQDTSLNDGNITPISKIHVSTILLLPIAEN